MSDKELVIQVTQHGNHKAFADIVHRYSGMVFSKALGIMHNEQDAAEVTQQSFIRAYENLDTWRGTELGPWLASIAVHSALKLLDKERRHSTSSFDELSGNALSRLSAENTYSEDHEARLQQMETAIAALPNADQQLLRLHYYEHCRTADIARQTGLSQSNVLVKLHRIRERLRKSLTTISSPAPSSVRRGQNE